MRMLFPAVLSATVALAGCTFDTDSTSRNASGKDGETCEKIEDSAIGQVGLQLQVGSTSVTFVSWQPKQDSPGEFVGFTIETTGEVIFRVKSGTETVEGSGTTWFNANGDNGPDANAISNVEVCEPDPECNDPDGCDNEPTDPTCNDPDGCEDEPDLEPDPECNDPDGCDNEPTDEPPIVD